MPSKNLPPATVLNAIADLLEEFPALHDQGHWETTPQEHSCGTTACIAGWACILGTDDFKMKEDGDSIFWIPKMRTVREYCDTPDLPKLNAHDRIMQLVGGYYLETGKKVLGLSDQEAELLFSGTGRPRAGLTVPEALRAIARGVPISNVWGHGDDGDGGGDYDYDYDDYDEDD